MANIVDLAMVTKFIKELVKPFDMWNAYKTGVIDKDGNILVKKAKRSPVQNKSFLKFDLLVLKLKKLLGKVPGGKSRLASYAAALWLIKEQNSERDVEALDEDVILEEFYDIRDSVEEFILEDGIVNSAGGGAIAGIGVGPQGEPGVSKKTQKKKKKILRRK